MSKKNTGLESAMTPEYRKKSLSEAQNLANWHFAKELFVKVATITVLSEEYTVTLL